MTIIHFSSLIRPVALWLVSVVLVLSAPYLDAAPTPPAGFEVNRGQTDSEVAFLTRREGYTLFLTRQEAVLALGGRAALRMRLVGADPKPRLTGEAPLPARSHYLLGRDPGGWVRGVEHFARVRYRQVYPGIDMLYGLEGRAPRYDFLLAPGTDPKKIELAFEGTEPPALDEGGNLVLKTPAGPLIHGEPFAFQEVQGERRRVDSAYELRGGNRVGFRVADHDPSLPLVIDPELLYSTYLGGPSGDSGQAVAVDGNGFAYVAGTTGSAVFPPAAPPLEIVPVGGQAGSAVYVAKMDPTRSGLDSLVQYTVIGGGRDEGAKGVAVDASGHVYVTGQTSSADFPTVGAPFPSLAGGTDAFLLKLTPDGSGLVYSTYLGGPDNDVAWAIAVDGSGHAAITGYTDSSTFPEISQASPALQSGYGGQRDAFVARLDSAGGSFVYSSYLGGGLLDEGHGIAVDAQGNAYVTGSTRSDLQFPITPNAAQSQQTNPSKSDAFLTIVDGLGSPALYSTYLGGAGGTEQGEDVALTANGVVMVAGFTDSNDFPATPGAFAENLATTQSCTVDCMDAFVARFDIPSLSMVSLSAVTLYGGDGDDRAFGVDVDEAERVYVSGRTNSWNLPRARPVQTTRGGGSCGSLGVPVGTSADPGDPNGMVQVDCPDAFVAKLTADLSLLTFGTYLGSASGDESLGLAVRPACRPLRRDCDAFAVGTTGGAVPEPSNSDGFPTTPQAFQFLPPVPSSNVQPGANAFFSLMSTHCAHPAMDLDRDGLSDRAVYQQGQWSFFDGSSTQLPPINGSGDDCIPAPMDHDGDGFKEPTELCDDVWTFFDETGNVVTQFQVPNGPGMLPVPADYDGDGVDDAVISYTDNFFWETFDPQSGASLGRIIVSSSVFTIPLPMDWNGDGRAEPTVYLRQTGEWRFFDSTGATVATLQVEGHPSFILPAPADYDGDCIDDAVVYNIGGSWQRYDPVTGQKLWDRTATVYTGSASRQPQVDALPAPVDQDDDGRDDLTLFEPGLGLWHFFDDEGSYEDSLATGGSGEWPVSRRPYSGF